MPKPLVAVALDGSELSERSLPYATAIADATGATLLLVTVWGGPERDLLATIPDAANDLLAHGEAHYQHELREVAKRLTVDAQTEVLAGDPAEEILRLVEERQPELLVLSTHGRSGISRWVSGSVASRLAREAPCATLVVGPQALERDSETATIERVMVPLDGSELSEAAIAPATDLATKLNAELLLVQALSWATQAVTFGVPDVDTTIIDKALTEAAQDYLDRVKARVRGVSVATKVLHGPPADALIDSVATEAADLVVMASHSRSGLARAALGSVADRMLQGPAPVLLVRPEAPPAVAPAPRRRRCHNCGRAVAYLEIDREDRCLRCGQHLRACSNCVYFDGMSCLLQRPEVHDTYPGRDCPRFQFRETEPPAAR